MWRWYQFIVDSYRCTWIVKEHNFNIHGDFWHVKCKDKQFNHVVSLWYTQWRILEPCGDKQHASKYLQITAHVFLFLVHSFGKPNWWFRCCMIFHEPPFSHTQRHIPIKRCLVRPLAVLVGGEFPLCQFPTTLAGPSCQGRKVQVLRWAFPPRCDCLVQVGFAVSTVTYKWPTWLSLGCI